MTPLGAESTTVLRPFRTFDADVVSCDKTLFGAAAAAAAAAAAVAKTHPLNTRFSLSMLGVAFFATQSITHTAWWLGILIIPVVDIICV